MIFLAENQWINTNFKILTLINQNNYGKEFALSFTCDCGSVGLVMFKKQRPAYLRATGRNNGVEALP